MLLSMLLHNGLNFLGEASQGQSLFLQDLSIFWASPLVFQVPIASLEVSLFVSFAYMGG